jgi:hypothetical protein
MHICLKHGGTNHNKNKTLNSVAAYIAVHIKCLYRQAVLSGSEFHQGGYSHEIRAGYLTRTAPIKQQQYTL